MSGFVATLPWPPSANRAWRAKSSGGGVVKAKAYVEFQRAVDQAVLIGNLPRHWTVGRLAFGMVCHPPRAGIFDIDNRVKTMLDALVRAGVIPDDHLVDQIILIRGRISPPTGFARIRLQEIGAGDLALDYAAWFDSPVSQPSHASVDPLRIITIKSNLELAKSAGYGRSSKRARGLNKLLKGRT